MGLEALCVDVEIERAHRTPTKVPVNNNNKPRPVHVAFLRYTDKVKILSNAAARLKDNPYQGNEFLVSKETVVLRRWERSKQKYGFVKRVDKR